jgi:hypothetical protein
VRSSTRGNVGEGRERRELFAGPLGALGLGEPRREPRRQRHQVLHVGERVRLLLLGQRPPRPVVLLAALRQLHAELVAHDRLQPELGISEQARRDRGIEQRAKREPEVATHRGHVVVSRVEHLEDRRIAQDRGERRQIEARQRIHQPRPAGVRRHLDQARLLGVVVQAVALDIEPDRLRAGELVDERCELRGGPDPGVHSPPIG